jgi:hypothetical protein
MPSKHDAMQATESSAGNEIVADTSHVEMRMRAKFGLDRIHERPFGATGRRNVDKRGRAGQKIDMAAGPHDQVAAP